MKRIGTAVAIATAALACAACGSLAQAPAQSQASTPTTEEHPGPVAFVEWAKTAEMGNRDMTQASDDQLLALGTQACNLMQSAPSFGWAVNEMVKEAADLEVTAGQMDEWLRHSVVNLCPQVKDLLP